ncbi:MAG: response regulator transcription factor [Niabella sp.]|nr:response regulator transcription factor [Niabella sp.]
MTPILLIEDDQRIAALTKKGLEEQDFEVSLCYDGAAGKEMAINNPFDIIITDIILPGINGIDLCKEIRVLKPDLPIIMLTALGTTNEKIEGFDAGADDYLVKPFELRELVARIRALLKRAASSKTSDSFLLRYEDIELNQHTKIVKRANREIDLTPKELKLLEYMLQNPERVLSRAEIAEKVWDTTFDTGTNFIDVYINYLRKKIEKDFPVKLIHTKPGMGFILKKG